MSNVVGLLVAALVAQAPPGKSGYSVEPAAAGRYSSYYQTTVKRESVETARARYLEIAEAIVASADDVLRETGWKRMTRENLIALSAGVAFQESGFREDVQIGRGRSGKPDDVGGEGRGPGNEACLAQIHPVIAWRFVDPDTDPALRAAAEKGDGKARETIARTLLGRDQAALRRCFRTQIRMLVHGAEWCERAGKTKRNTMQWSAIAMYVSGVSCTTTQGGKTALRYRATDRFLDVLEGFVPAAAIAATPTNAAKSCSSVVFTPVAPGWTAIQKRTRAQARWARELLGSGLKIDDTRERELGGEPLLARGEVHCDPRRGPHRGVSLYRKAKP